jgi:hypothetical protein
MGGEGRGGGSVEGRGRVSGGREAHLRRPWEVGNSTRVCWNAEYTGVI